MEHLCHCASHDANGNKLGNNPRDPVCTDDFFTVFYKLKTIWNGPVCKNFQVNPLLHVLDTCSFRSDVIRHQSSSGGGFLRGYKIADWARFGTSCGGWPFTLLLLLLGYLPVIRVPIFIYSTLSAATYCASRQRIFTLELLIINFIAVIFVWPA